ncbi:hypothetical protein CRUP_027858, partial [Coryphaenoides rupestris]
DDLTPPQWRGSVSALGGSQGPRPSPERRPSKKNVGDFSLSVRINKDVTHIRIQNTGDFYDLYGGEKFATLSELVDYYTAESGVLQDKDGHLIEIKYPLNSSDPTAEREDAVQERGVGDLLGEGLPVQAGGLCPPFYTTRVIAADIDTRVKLLDQTDQSLEEGPGEKSKAGFWEEFDALQKLEAKVKKSREEGQRPENKSKNRYKNILPFNDTRVVLHNADPASPGSDYINANYVRNTLRPDDKKLFIATQGCLATTVNDFWQMVWQEKTRNKCAPYWPEVNSYKEVGPYVVNCISETDATDYKVRVLEMALKNKSQKTCIWHYQYLSWPDHGVPQEPGGVLSFLAQVNAKQDDFDEPGPMIIHCSAGIGRTGTFMVIDMILHTIETQGVECDIDIQRCIQMVREQRSGMVQTEAQYKFIYLAVSEHIQALDAHHKASMQQGGAL